MRMPKFAKEFIEEAARWGHQLLSQGCGKFRCAACDRHWWIDEHSGFREKCAGRPDWCHCAGGTICERHAAACKAEADASPKWDELDGFAPGGSKRTTYKSYVDYGVKDQKSRAMGGQVVIQVFDHPQWNPYSCEHYQIVAWVQPTRSFVPFGGTGPAYYFKSLDQAKNQMIARAAKARVAARQRWGNSGTRS